MFQRGFLQKQTFWEGACGFETSGLEERIGLIMNYKKISRVTVNVSLTY